MKVVGLTGGIGSGKTTVAKLFESLDVPVYYADDEAKKLYISNTEMKTEIIQNFGQETYVDGRLNSAYLGGQVFGDKKKLALLNSIVHPRVRTHFDNWLVNHKDKQLVIKEAAILIETGGAQSCDYIVLVTAPENTRIERVIARDKTTQDKVKDRIDKQMSDAEKNKYADFVIDNSGDDLLIPQVVKILTKIIEN